MCKLAWIWFAGCFAWVIDGLIGLYYRNWPQAELAFAVAAVFFAAGMLYRRQRR